MKFSILLIRINLYCGEFLSILKTDFEVILTAEVSRPLLEEFVSKFTGFRRRLLLLEIK